MTLQDEKKWAFFFTETEDTHRMFMHNVAMLGLQSFLLLHGRLIVNCWKTDSNTTTHTGFAYTCLLEPSRVGAHCLACDLVLSLNVSHHKVTGGGFGSLTLSLQVTIRIGHS